VKLKHHRLKPGGVSGPESCLGVAVKLKYHRLKPGGVSGPESCLGVAVKLKDHRLKPVVFERLIFNLKS